MIAFGGDLCLQSGMGAGIWWLSEAASLEMAIRNTWNSGDTPLFTRAGSCIGMYKAKDIIAKERKAILTKGYLDVIACHQAGVV